MGSDVVAEKSGPGLEFSIDVKSGVPFYKQIILQIEMAIAGNRLRQGDQLPTVRSMAVELKVNPNTVAKAYNQLELRGIVTTRQGTGTFISDKRIEMSDIERERVLSQMCRTFVSRAASYGFTVRDLVEHLTEMGDEA